MPTYYIYPIYISVLFLVLITLVPRRAIRKLMIYGITFGAIGDFIAILVFTHLLGVGGYLKYGPFGFSGIPFFPLLAWTIWFVMYFYFMPERKRLRYIYIATAAVHAVLFSNLLANFDIFEWNYSEIILPFLIYITWFSGSAWVKEQVDKK